MTIEDDILKSAFSNEAAIYDETTCYLLLDYDLLLNETIKKIGYPSDAEFKILDLGCGTGNLVRLIREKYCNADVYALDFSDTMLEVFRKKDVPDIHYISADMFKLEEEHLPFFDVIVSSFVFHNFESISDHNRIFKLMNNHLSVNGSIIITDLIDFANPHKRKNYQAKLVDAMKAYELSNDEIIRWMGILEMEDSPLTVENNCFLMHENDFENINFSLFENSGSAIFTGKKKTNYMQLKLELLFNGVKENEFVKRLYIHQNPQQVWKTGNNGVFLTINGLDVLVGINHEDNRCSPYEVDECDGVIVIKKNDVIVARNVSYMKPPEWFYSNIRTLNNRPFSDFFVLEGDRYLHLAYKGCSFEEKDKCKFCSTERRKEANDNEADDVCEAIRWVIEDLPENIHICLGGGTYIPFEDNVLYFSKIIRCIRRKRIDIPIWIECIPPKIEDIDRLISDGATGFGFNIEVWDEEKRKVICPGKSIVSKEEYITALKYVVERLGANKVGSCIIVGLDSYDNIKSAIDSLVKIGVEPCILPYKKYDETNMTNFPISAGYQYDFYRLSKYASWVSENHNVIFENNQGCLKCTCCTIMHDIQKIGKYT